MGAFLFYYKNGAGEGNRTLATGLEGQGSTTELHPLKKSEVRNQKSEVGKQKVRTSDFKLPTSVWSGRRDSNSRPPGPKPGALPNCATPRKLTRYIVTSISLDVNILFLKNIRSLTSFYRQCQ